MSISWVDEWRKRLGLVNLYFLCRSFILRLAAPTIVLNVKQLPRPTLDFGSWKNRLELFGIQTFFRLIENLSRGNVLKCRP